MKNIIFCKRLNLHAPTSHIKMMGFPEMQSIWKPVKHVAVLLHIVPKLP